MLSVGRRPTLSMPGSERRSKVCAPRSSARAGCARIRARTSAALVDAAGGSSMAAWDDLFTEADLEGYRKASWDTPRELGGRPGIVVVDMSYAFVDDRFPTGWGKTGWPCAEAIRRLLEVARP